MRTSQSQPRARQASNNSEYLKVTKNGGERDTESKEDCMMKVDRKDQSGWRSHYWGWLIFIGKYRPEKMKTDFPMHLSWVAQWAAQERCIGKSVFIFSPPYFVGEYSSAPAVSDSGPITTAADDPSQWPCSCELSSLSQSHQDGTFFETAVPPPKGVGDSALKGPRNHCIFPKYYIQDCTLLRGPLGSRSYNTSG
jgi:hypothetical protein